MEKITTIGLDIAKQVFQVHGVDAAGAILVRRKRRRDDVIGFFEGLVGIEACATGDTIGLGFWRGLAMRCD
jgi:transposase